tara:strand:- start:10890 stop:13022 length:2133 start_codon:yes stop_codon:yes gene_type:complete
MKQLIQSFSDGSTQLVDVPKPSLSPNKLLIQSSISLLSSGTEKMLVDFGKANLLGKIKQQPDKVKQVLDKAAVDGPLSALEAVQSKLQQPFPLGYSNVGRVIEIGELVKDFKVGDRVVSNGPHAELFTTTKNLCAQIPDSVSDEAAAFTIVSSIGLQGIRLASPSLGETFLVSGLGLIGLLTGQILKINGCKVLGIDPDRRKTAIANSLGIKSITLKEEKNTIDWCLENTKGIGVDGTLITASTSSSDPIDLAAKASRKRARIILVGVTGLNLKRELFYKKELSFQVSCSYGPGRYDIDYEQKGIDYPIAFVRWTEQRNFETILQSLESGLLKTNSLITHRFPFENAPKAYDLIRSQENSLGIIFNYPNNISLSQTIEIESQPEINFQAKNPQISFIGAGNYAYRSLIPAFKKAGVNFLSISATNGLLPSFIGKKYNFKNSSTDVESILNNKDCNTIVIATRHDSHSELIQKSLSLGKNVFVEKPLCLTTKELDEIKNVYFETQKKFQLNKKSTPLLMVGFNRRFSPLVKKLKYYLKDIEQPKAFIYTCNAGSIPSNHWINDLSIGGGRLIGESCHFVDLIRYLTGSKIKDINVNSVSKDIVLGDTFILQVSFEDKSIATINYFSNGSKSFPKERLEVFAGGNVFQLDNFRKLKAWGAKNYISKKILIQDKGQNHCIKSFIEAIQFAKASPIPINEIFEVQRLLLKAIKR